MAIDAIKSIRMKSEDENLFKMAKDLNTFWKKYTQQDLLIIDDLADYDGAINLIVDSDFDSLGEAYELEIKSDKISIKAESAEGVFRGIKTLEQIIVLSQLAGGSEFLSLPGGKINDHPYYEYRGAMLDVARHFFSVTDVKRYIDILSIYKINFLHFHLSDDQGWRIEIKSRPKLTEIGGQTEVGGGKGGFYTQEEFKEIVAYAAERFITIVPEIDLPGHTNAALASYANLNCNGKATKLYTGTEVGFSTLCVDKEETYEFVDDVIREISEMTPGPYFHIGGDEAKKTQWENSSEIQELMKNLGIENVDSLQSYFTGRVERILSENGKKLIGWDEIIEGGLNENAIVMSWRGEEGGITAVKAGNKAIMTPTSHMYFDYYQAKKDEPIAIGGLIDQEKVYTYEPVS